MVGSTKDFPTRLKPAYACFLVSSGWVANC